MEQLMDAVITLLQAEGLHTVGEMQFEPVPRLQEPVCAVRLEKAQLLPAGFLQYLGVVDDEANGQTELYGARMEATVALHVYSPVAAGAPVCSAAARRAVDALLGAGKGLTVAQMEMGACTYDPKYDHFTAKVTALLYAWVYRRAEDEAAQFIDFNLRGELE